MANESFGKAFAEARKKFRANPSESNFTFTWEDKQGKRNSYNILQEGETKKSVMEKYGKSPEKSPRPQARPSSSGSSDSSSGSSEKPVKTEGGTGGPRRGSNKPKASGALATLEPQTKTDTTDDARASRGTARTRESKAPESSPRPRPRPAKDSSSSSSSGERGLLKDPMLRKNLRAIGDFIGSFRYRPPEKKAKGGLVGASNPPSQKATPRYKK